MLTHRVRTVGVVVAVGLGPPVVGGIAAAVGLRTSFGVLAVPASSWAALADGRLAGIPKLPGSP